MNTDSCRCQQILSGLTKQIAQYWPAGDIQDRYAAAADNFRIPYWDWAAVPPAGQSVFPNSMWNSSSITIDGPAGTQTIANPLFDFQFKPLNVTELPDWPVSIHIPSYRSCQYCFVVIMFGLRYLCLFPWVGNHAPIHGNFLIFSLDKILKY